MSDAIRFGDIQQYAGPDVSSWPVGASITRVIFQPGNWQVEFTRMYDPNRWPDVVPPGWEGPLQFTLWPVIWVNAAWRTCPAIEFWYQGPPLHGRYDGVGGPYSKGQVDWWYHVAEMAYQPTAGETVGFFVTTAVRRQTPDVSWLPLKERSNVVTGVVPANDSGSIDFVADGGDGGTTPPDPEPEPPVDTAGLEAAMRENTDATIANTIALTALTSVLGSARKGIR